MTYYKVIQNNEFIGIGTSCELRKYQTKHNILLVANDDTAQYIDVRGVLYRDSWFKPINSDDITVYENANINVISEEEYHQLLEAIDKGEEIELAQEQDIITDNLEQSEQQISIEETITIDFLKEQKIKEMSYICNQIISNGIDVVLSDGNTHHFSLSIQDQLNFIALSSLIKAGENIIPYHADGELCRYYSADDISKVIKIATEFKTYHTTYYNSLKAYIQSIQDRESMRTIAYGIEIPLEYQSDILKAILANIEDKNETSC